MKRVAVALSGGLDSSVTAFLLKKAGYDVVGLTGKMINSDSAEVIIDNAKQVADFLGIKHYVLDTSKEFQANVIDYFNNSYKDGRTPNPCIMCNKFIKWGALLDYAINELGVDYIATGHYANIKKDNNYYKLYPAKDTKKDQLYFLFQLNQAQLSRTLFPLFNYEKSEIRQIAIENNLPTKSSKESQDICFIQKPLTTKKYLLEHLKSEKGNFVDIETNKTLGTHNGYFQYTVGQRKGIGIAASEPLYVVKVDAKENIVYVGSKKQLEKGELILDNFNFSYPIERKEFSALCKIRYNMQATEVVVNINQQQTIIKFKTPVAGIAIGQACVLYDINDGYLIGGGFI